MQQSSGRGNYDSFLPPFKQLQVILHGFGGRSVSYRRAISAYKLNESSTEWIEDVKYMNSDFSNYQCIISNGNLYQGSSSGVTTKSDLIIHENVPTTTDEPLTLVEFISIHFGGAFIPCRDCLSHVIPSNRPEIGPDDIRFLHGCQICHDNRQILVSYNYGVSAHHAAFQEYYRRQKQYYVALFGGNLPKPSNDYYDLHHI